MGRRRETWARDVRGREMKFPSGGSRRRPDHNEALVRVRCEACGKEQKNDVARCRGCKHEYGTYQLAC